MAKYRLLIVDDDPGTQEILAQLLNIDYEVITADNGMDALGKLDKVQPDLVIADVMMPVMNGWEFVERLRQNDKYLYTPVVFLTALWQKQHRDLGYEKGADVYVTKPIEPERLIRLVQQQLDDSGKQPQLKTHMIEELLNDELKRKSVFEQPVAAIAGGEPDGPGELDSSVSGDLEAKSSRFSVEGPGDKLKVRVMVVDDDTDIQQLIKMELEDDFEILLAGDGLEAMDKALKYKPDVFVVDWMMPKFSGYQMVDVLRRTHEFSESPIIFISARGNTNDRKLAERLEITEFIAKPFTPNKIRDSIDREISKPGFQMHPNKLPLEFE